MDTEMHYIITHLCFYDYFYEYIVTLLYLHSKYNGT